MENNTLQHHGVLGMHWGVRRYQPYRTGERVAGGREIGQATKVQQRDAKYLKKHPEAQKAKNILDERIASRKKTISEYQESLDRAKRGSREEYEKAAKKEIQNEVEMLKEAWNNGIPGTVKNPTKQDAIDSLLLKDGGTEKEVVDLMMKGEIGNKELEKYQKSTIKEYEEFINKYSKMSLKELNKRYKKSGYEYEF